MVTPSNTTPPANDVTPPSTDGGPSDDSVFSAIDKEPTDEEFSANQNSSSIDPSAAYRRAAEQCEIDERNQIIFFRKVLFYGALGVAAFTILFFVSLVCYYMYGGMLLKIAEYSDWHLLVASDAIFVATVFLPLSIFWTLSRMTQKYEEIKKEEKQNDDLVKSFSSIIISVKDFIATLKSSGK